MSGIVSGRQSPAATTSKASPIVKMSSRSSVTCGPPTDTHYEDDASWVVEVLSDSTRDKDEREKSVAYLKLPSIRGYLLVETTSRTIQLRTPAEVGWHIRYCHEDDVLDLDGLQIKVRELYDRLDRLAPSTSSLD